MNKLVEIEREMIRNDFPQFGPGDTIKVYFRVHEGKKEKVQAFQGVCIQTRGASINRSITVRKISQGIGVERIFPLNSPTLEKIEVVRFGKIRRAKLYYLRDKVGKGRVLKERIVAKKDSEKQGRKRRASRVASDEDSEQAHQTVEDSTAEKQPAEVLSQEASDARDKSGQSGVEES